MKNSGMPQTIGVKFTQETKAQMATHLKQAMIEKRLKIPYDSNLIAELHNERYELTKDGKIKLNHPPNTHGDLFWALGLATYAARTEPSPTLWVLSKRSKGKAKLEQLRKKLSKHQAAGVTR